MKSEFWKELMKVGFPIVLTADLTYKEFVDKTPGEALKDRIDNLSGIADYIVGLSEKDK